MMPLSACGPARPAVSRHLEIEGVIRFPRGLVINHEFRDFRVGVRVTVEVVQLVRRDQTSLDRFLKMPNVRMYLPGLTVFRLYVERQIPHSYSLRRAAYLWPAYPAFRGH